MKRIVVVVFSIGAMMIATSPTLAQADRLEWTGRLERGQMLEIQGIEGDIRAELALGGEAEILARKTGDEIDFDQVDIRMVENKGGVTVCAVYSWWSQGKTACDIRKKHDERRGREKVRAGVDFVVRVPAGVELMARTVSGSVEAKGLQSRVDASTVDGSVTVSTSEVAQGSTVSGSLDVEMGSTDWKDLDFTTVSGDITLTLPADLHTKIEFESLSGELTSDFDVRLRGHDDDRLVGVRLKGTIGDGGRQLSFKTVDGDIRLRRKD
jgi:DUF4097 and DUF4098 domain-containing protein YvlB